MSVVELCVSSINSEKNHEFEKKGEGLCYFSFVQKVLSPTYPGVFQGPSDLGFVVIHYFKLQ